MDFPCLDSCELLFIFLAENEEWNTASLKQYPFPFPFLLNQTPSGIPHIHRNEQPEWRKKCKHFFLLVSSRFEMSKLDLSRFPIHSFTHTLIMPFPRYSSRVSHREKKRTEFEFGVSWMNRCVWRKLSLSNYSRMKFVFNHRLKTQIRTKFRAWSNKNYKHSTWQGEWASKTWHRRRYVRPAGSAAMYASWCLTAFSTKLQTRFIEWVMTHIWN